MYSNEDVICISSAYIVGYLMIIMQLNLFEKSHFLVKTNGNTKLFSIQQKAVIVIITLNKGTSHG
jgi:hypothetical protein